MGVDEIKEYLYIETSTQKKGNNDMGSVLNLFKKVIKILLTVVVGFITPTAVVFALLMFAADEPFWGALFCFVPAIIPAIWIKRRKPYLIVYTCLLLLTAAIVGVQWGIDEYRDSITIDVAPNIDVYEYLPFEEDSKIVKLDSKTLKFTEEDELPRIDGASAAFPVYSAFVNAVYPNTVELYDGVFEYNTTDYGYRLLAQRKTDIFIGAGPSKAQKAYAEEQGTEFVYTQIGWEAFVFFVHKDNPIDSLSWRQ